MNGQELEKRIWSRVVEFLTTLDVFLAAAKELTGNTQSASEMAQTAVKRLENQIKELDIADARAFGAYARSITSEQTYVHAATELKAERAWLEEDLASQRRVLAESQRLAANALNVQKIYPRLA